MQSASVATRSTMQTSHPFQAQAQCHEGFWRRRAACTSDWGSTSFHSKLEAASALLQHCIWQVMHTHLNLALVYVVIGGLCSWTCRAILFGSWQQVSVVLITHAALLHMCRSSRLRRHCSAGMTLNVAVAPAASAGSLATRLLQDLRAL